MIKTLLWQMNTDTAKTLDRGTFYFLFSFCFVINFIVKIWQLLIFYLCYSCRTFRKASKKADLFNAGDNIYIPTIYCEQDKDQHYIDFYPLIKRQLTRITVLRMRACGSGLRDWMIFVILWLAPGLVSEALTMYLRPVTIFFFFAAKYISSFAPQNYIIRAFETRATPPDTKGKLFQCHNMENFPSVT